MVLGVLDLTQQPYDLLCGGILRQGLSLGRLPVVGEAHLPEVFGKRKADVWSDVWALPTRPSLPPSPRALLTTRAVGHVQLLRGWGCTGLTSRVLGSSQELAIPFIPLAH